MKILYLCHRIPYPPNKGDKIRSFNEIKFLSAGHEIHLACLADNPADLKYENDLKKYCVEISVVPFKTVWAKLKSSPYILAKKPLTVHYFYSRSLQETMNRWLSSNSYDAIICYSSTMPEYLFRAPSMAYRFSSKNFPGKDKSLKTESKRATRNSQPATNNAKLIMDFCDVDSDKWRQYSQQSRFPFSRIYKTEFKRLLEYEKRINRHFDHSIFVSQQEADLFLRLDPEAGNITVIPNGVDCRYFSPHATSNEQRATSNQHPVLLFTGAMDYHANVEGVIWFCNEIFPRIQKDFPESRFYIVGSNPHPRVKDLENKNGIRVTGFVEDIRPYYQTADVSVIPLRLARGVHNKVLEAMAMGKAIVTTPKAIEGIQAVPGENVLVEDTPGGFSDAVSNLLRDREHRRRLGAKARAFVSEKFDWQTNMQKFETLLPA